MSAPPFLTPPPGVRRLDIDTARGRFAALEAVPGSRAPERRPALLVPGFTGSKEDFIAVLPALTKDGRRVIAIDQRGQYETPGPDDPAAYTCAELAADIAAVLDALGSAGVHLVGHSFGGLVGREVAIAEPARLASVTLMGSGPAAVDGSSAERARALREALTSFEVAHIWDTYLEPEAVADGRAPEIVAFLRERMLGNAPAGLTGMINELVSAPDRVDALAKVIGASGLPALVLYGEDDDVWEPRVQAEMADRLAARKAVIPGAAHSPAVEAPETTASMLTTFWAEAERSS
ncbi:MAG TPA: alpha/beta hydrolase [Streptosporangiaceae bacterium]|nr:alpha/beta hydrolase [Streptosporangiaceae bacterium]